MALALVVTDPFDDPVHGHYQVNQIVRDPDKVAYLGASDRKHHFRRVDLPAEPAAAPVEAAPAKPRRDAAADPETAAKSPAAG